MQQVLFFIPVKVDWLPDFFPLPVLVFVVLLLSALAAWFVGAPRQLFGVATETWQNSAKWLGGFGAAVGLGMYVASLWWPAGIPVHGFGMMLFAAFLLCNWVGGRLVKDIALKSTFMTVATGSEKGKDCLPSSPQERTRRAQDFIQDTSVFLFIFGILGARITSVLNQKPPPTTLWDFVIQLPMIWEGGIVFYGSMIGASIAFAAWYVFYYFRKNIRLDAFKLADVAAPPLALGLCLGRIGCLLNGCCYGQVACADCAVQPIHFPLSAPSRYSLVRDGLQTATGFTVKAQPAREGGAIVEKVVPHSPAAAAGLQSGDLIKQANDATVEGPSDLDRVLSMDAWPRGAKKLTLTIADPNGGEPHAVSFAPYTIGLHPTQVYESISMFLLFWMLLAFWPLRTRDGQVMALLMMCYGVHRSLNELLRNDPRPEGFESHSSIFLIVGGAILFGVLLWLRPAITVSDASQRRGAQDATPKRR
jgi:phosphatidylglycerol---prolipoprotein diacylglyceryl transferase